MFKPKNNHVMLGNKKVEIPKLTRKNIKKLTSHIGSIGDFLVQLFLTPSENRATFIVVASEMFIDEMYELVALLSEIDIDYLDENATLEQVTNYIKQAWEQNDMEKALGNAKSLLHPMAEQFVMSIVNRMGNGENSQQMNSSNNVPLS
ncbi:hypothetical protein [Schinkia azotoformans]|uniref:hypothetical protein n=1 Tax=Schinkia azotoformans TaxID=1454 RepID=UPI002DBC5EFC|nr:hypothetical protein [Schinkia azotoformans]MEC1714763.1 hypothetical protein [Schinkia azotoformans]MEC1757481.1 hypothetical protein [Schinkia azotoformans]